MPGPITDPIGQVERTQTLIEHEPIAFVAALGFVVAVLALYLLFRAKDKHLVAQAQQHKEYADRLDRLREAAAERSIKLELMLHGFLELIDDVRYIAFEARKRSERAQRPKSGEHKLPPTGGG